MLNLNNYLKILNRKEYFRRFYSRQLRDGSSNAIRQQFLDYFNQDHRHTLVRSSPVVPFCDPSVAFVNAGMNQFKNVFLGQSPAPHKRVANSQKCVRVGGKHNDLSVVGTDGYHHTFFEMLGNWSFGDYFKKEACELAWNLLKGPYQMDPNRLYVTYFKGDTNLNIEPDLECKEIWKSLGVPEERILPFGLAENFWEMGSTGPCGPCTEIHYDHLPPNKGTVKERAQRVNAGHSDLTELWNLVFIQYNRNSDGQIESLPMKHIDTGMGMERLVAILQKKASNYATDLFTPIFDEIHKTSNVPSYQDCYNVNDEMFNLMTAYRVLGDHSRMIAVCLADGMFPDTNHKLRRVLRKTISMCDKQFGQPQLLHKIIPIIVDNLGETYPELHAKSSQIHQIVQHETDVFNSLIRNTSKDLKNVLKTMPLLHEYDVIDYPGFIPAMNELRSLPKCGKMSGEMMFKLYDTYGLNEELIEKIAENEQLELNRTGFSECLQRTRNRTKQLFSKGDSRKQKIYLNHKLPKTQNDAKYNYTFDKNSYQFRVPQLSATVLSIEQVGGSDVNSEPLFNVILDKSNFYYTSGGQASDVGKVVSEDGDLFIVKNVSFENGLVIHTGSFSRRKFEVGHSVRLHVNNEQRTGNIQNHTATHLLNAAVKHVKKCVTYQRSSNVSADGFKLELGIIGTKIEGDDIESIQQLIRDIIQSSTPVNVSSINVHELYASNDISLIPGEIYPDHDLRILTIANENLSFLSKEPCCGTHATNTEELTDFCITNVKLNGRSSYLFTGISGAAAEQARKIGENMLNDIRQLKCDFDIDREKYDFASSVQRFKNMFSQGQHVQIPHNVKVQCVDIINAIVKQMKDTSKDSLKELIEIEMQNVLERNPSDRHPFIIHCLSSAHLMDSVPLQKATRLCTDRPVIVIGLCDGAIKARCCVPNGLIRTPNFTAEKWLNEVATIFKAQIGPPRGQNPNEVCNMKAKKISTATFEDQLEVAIQKASEYAKQYL